MKTGLEAVLDGTAILYRLFLGAICYKVNPDITVLMGFFYLVNVACTFYYLHLKEKEDREFIKMAHDAIKKATEDYERNKTDTE